MRCWPRGMHAQREATIAAAELESNQTANNTFEDPGVYLNEGELPSENDMKLCPEVRIKIESEEVKALIDTGSQVTCVSRDWFVRHEAALGRCEKLPVVNFRIKEVTGGAPVKVNEQIFAEITISNLNDRICFLVVPRIKHNVIIGIDTLRKWKSNIDLQINKLRIQVPSGQGSVELLESTYLSERLISCVENNKVTGLNSDQALSLDIKSRLTDDEIVDKLTECQVLNQNELSLFKELLKEYNDVFLKIPGRISVYEHQIKIHEDRPFVRRSYPIPILHWEKVKLELKKMLDLGIIERSYSEYINPLVVVEKKSGEIRLVLDARYINRLIVPDHDCAQSTEVLFQKCGNSKFMPSLDLTASFWQIPLHPESRKYTAFMHEGKTYQFTGTPYGLSTSLASLIRALDIILRETEPFTVNFVDDILCISDSVRSHLRHLKQLFETFRRNNMTLNFKKSKFLRDEIDFLGHRITKTGIKPQNEKIEAIKNFPVPKNAKQLKGFLGLTNYYSKFAKKYSDATYPLLASLKSSSKWN